MRESFGLKHSRIRPYCPKTNGKAERLIQTALRECVYGPEWQSSEQRNQALTAWLHHYNHHRPHSALGGQPPVTRLNNLVGNDTSLSAHSRKPKSLGHLLKGGPLFIAARITGGSCQFGWAGRVNGFSLRVMLARTRTTSSGQRPGRTRCCAGRCPRSG